MIEIRIDGMIFAMECTTNQDTRCDECKAGDFCRSGNRVGHWCGKAEYDNMLVCTSATPIAETEEARICHAWDMWEAGSLVGKKVECHTGASDASWEESRLVRFQSSGAPFMCEEGEFYMIREIPTIKKTWSQIQAEHPELAGIELVKESPNA